MESMIDLPGLHFLAIYRQMTYKRVQIFASHTFGTPALDAFHLKLTPSASRQCAGVLEATQGMFYEAEMGCTDM